MSVVTVAKTVQFFNSTEGKDKKLKFIQFTLRALSDICLRAGGADWAKRLAALWRAILTGRNLSWLGKSLNEYQSCVALGQQADAAKTAQMRTILSFTRTCRAFFGIRWAVENLKILGAVGFLPSIDGTGTGVWNVRAKWIWLSALFFGISAELMRLQLNAQERTSLRMIPSCSSAELWHRTAPPTAPTASEHKAEKEKKLDEQRLQSMKQIVAFCADGMVACHVVQMPRHLGLWNGGFSDLVVGACGMCSSAIQTTNLWPK